jgi:hypothetical protein
MNKDHSKIPPFSKGEKTGPLFGKEGGGEIV